MVDLEKAIEASAEIMARRAGREFSKYCCSYFGTTENIAGYLRNLEFNKQRALTPIASGDHIFNLAFEGVKKIDAFDINELTYYLFYLKRAMILALSYEEYLSVGNILFSRDVKRLEELLARLKPFMPQDVYLYYLMMLELEKNEFYCQFSNLFRYTGLAKECNLYLETQDAYLKTREMLANIDVSFMFGDALNLGDSLTSSYDLIFLSNISDYLFKACDIEKGKFMRYLRSYYDLLNNGGALINYVYDYKAYYPLVNNDINAFFKPIMGCSCEGTIMARKRVKG